MDSIDKNKDKLKLQNYSSKSGSNMEKIKNDNLILEKSQNSTCRVCENKNKEESNYCEFCGENLSEVKENIGIQGEKKELINIKSTLQFINIPKLFITSLSAVAILFMISIIFKLVIGFQFGELSDLINPAYIVMGLNLGYMDISGSTMLGSGYLNAHIGALVLLIAPIVALSISNLVFMRKENNSAKYLVLNSLGVGILYALILTALSIVTKSKVNPYDMMKYSMALEISYRSLSIFINGFLIGFLCTYILGFKKIYAKENIYLDIIKKSITTIFLGYIVVLLLLVVITISDKSYLYEFGMYGYIENINVGIVLSQLAVYMWGFANFISVTISNYTISVFNLLGSDLFFDTKLIFIIMISLSSLIILMAGCNLKRKYSKSKINVILIFSISYALFMGILALFSSVVIGGNVSLLEMNNYQASLMLGLPVMSTVIKSFLYSFIVASIGYKLYIFE